MSGNKQNRAETTVDHSNRLVLFVMAGLWALYAGGIAAMVLSYGIPEQELASGMRAWGLCATFVLGLVQLGRGRLTSSMGVLLFGAMVWFVAVNPNSAAELAQWLVM